MGLVGEDLILPRTGSGTEAGETTPGTWPYFQLMHKALGDKDSVKPLNLISTAGDVAGNPEQQPDEETPHTSSGCCSGFPATSDSPPATAPGTSGTPTPGSSKRKRNEVLEYIRDYTERQDKRQRELEKKEEEREDRKEKQLDQLIGILAKLADNSK
ncbi:uncharacterized protein LOC121638256 isoform X2 [Xyrichtys novacula]|uniref:Uncharacterized protein LOC121638256 isoform X2 n=1 Tax=Xyrichtys novacula TaxID=13765 RepID=A0AAV1FAL6_XYRNO|nr:uncharacterized protein LOC121638256 isoform X2 [Xyrichtys novacula]